MFRARFVAVLVVGVQANGLLADEYTKWTRDEAKKTLVCEYTYTPKEPAAKGPPKQTVVIFYADKERSGWAYFYNAAQSPWARCAVPGNPKYDPKAMTWEALTPDGKGYEPFKDRAGEAYPAGYCPAPKDGKNPIPDLPLPPK